MKQFFRRPKNTSLFILASLILLNFLPFRSVTQVSDNVGNPIDLFVRSDAGFEDLFLIIPQLFLLIPLTFMYFSKSKLGHLLSVLFSFTSLFPLAVVYFAITFNFELDPPYFNFSLGIGYVLLCILIIFLHVSAIDFYFKAKSKKQLNQDLIDQLIG
jgi:hypothetical protein